MLKKLNLASGIYISISKQLSILGAESSLYVSHIISKLQKHAYPPSTTNKGVEPSNFVDKLDLRGRNPLKNWVWYKTMRTPVYN